MPTDKGPRSEISCGNLLDSSKMISLAGASFIIIASPWKRSMESCLKASERILKQFFVSSTISISMVENILGQGSKQGDRKITECSNRPRARRQRSVANYPIPNATSRRGRSDARWHRKRSSLQSSCIYIIYINTYIWASLHKRQHDCQSIHIHGSNLDAITCTSCG